MMQIYFRFGVTQVLLTMRPFCRFSHLQRIRRIAIDAKTKYNLVSIAYIHKTAQTSNKSSCTTQNRHTFSSLPVPGLQDNGKLLTFNDIYFVQKRFRTKKSKNKQIKSEKETEEESESDNEEEEEEEEESELDYDAPLVHKDMVVYTLRADSIVAKGLKLSHHEAERLFYSSRFLLNGKKLLKKGIKLHAGDILDVVVDRSQDKLFVKRVKVLKVEGVSSKGKEVVHIRLWRDPFEIDHPEDYQYTADTE